MHSLGTVLDQILVRKVLWGGEAKYQWWQLRQDGSGDGIASLLTLGFSGSGFNVIRIHQAGALRSVHFAERMRRMNHYAEAEAELSCAGGRDALELGARHSIHQRGSARCSLLSRVEAPARLRSAWCVAIRRGLLMPLPKRRARRSAHSRGQERSPQQPTRMHKRLLGEPRGGSRIREIH